MTPAAALLLHRSRCEALAGNIPGLPRGATLSQLTANSVTVTPQEGAPWTLRLNYSVAHMGSGSPTPMRWTAMDGSRTPMRWSESVVWWFQMLRVIFFGGDPCLLAPDANAGTWIAVAAQLPATEQANGIVPNFNATGLTYAGQPATKWTWHAQIRNGRCMYLAIGVAYADASAGALAFATLFQRRYALGPATPQAVATVLGIWKGGTAGGTRWRDRLPVANAMLGVAARLLTASRTGAVSCRDIE